MRRADAPQGEQQEIAGDELEPEGRERKPPPVRARLPENALALRQLARIDDGLDVVEFVEFFFFHDKAS